MAVLTDFNNPSFVLFPVNNNRTAWRPVSLPVILVVPHRRDIVGGSYANAEMFNVRVYIEGVPRESLVAGPQHIGQRFPDKELYAQTIDALTLADRIIDLSNLIITRDGVEVDQPQNGDLISYTTNTGTRDTIPFLVGADYYDLSDISIDVESLPSDQYNLVYGTNYFKRVISQDGRDDFLCIDVNTQALAILKFKIDHPGKVLEEFYRLTPPPYLTNVSKALDTTIGLYRPLTDVLQDVMDEQELLESINWVFDTPAEAIPYLSSLLGWDIPYFPQSLDQLRRAVLRRTVEFQNLKGSRRAIINIFSLFGFQVLISNLWWSSDGKRLIRPDENLPTDYKDQEIVTKSIDQVETVIASYQLTDFTTLTIPLLYRPQEKSGLDEFTALRDTGSVTLTFYAVSPGSPAQLALDDIASQIAANPSGWGTTANCQQDSDGFVFPQSITAALYGKELAGYSQLRISGMMGTATDEVIVGKQIPVRVTGLTFNRETNNLTLTFNGLSDLTDVVIYGFAAYKRFEFTVPDILADLQSNRFDLQVLTQALDEFADPTTLEFAVEFLYKLKAFHSLLNVIRTRIELTETYTVTDLCVGGNVEQRYDTDIGRLQVPPAIIPRIPGDLSDCSKLDALNIGYKDSDIQLRVRMLTNLVEEFAAWQILDGRNSAAPGQLTPNQPILGRPSCVYTPYGQDRKTAPAPIESWDTQASPRSLANSTAAGYTNSQELAFLAASNSDSSIYGQFTREYREITEAVCKLDGATDYCYKGRVNDELLYRPTFIGKEISRLAPTTIAMGAGVYWLYPAVTKPVLPGVSRKDSRSLTVKTRFSGKAPGANRHYFLDDVQEEYLIQPYNKVQTTDKFSLLGELYRDYGAPTNETLHFSNRLGSPNLDQHHQLALQRPSLEITKATLHLPGCRFPTMNKLKHDYTSQYWARPWDTDLCGPRNICGNTDPDFLNFTMSTDANGNQSLVFETRPYTILGNNLDADITDLNGQSHGGSFVPSAVVHKVYLEDADTNPAVELDGVISYDTNVSNGLVETDDPLFASHIQCNTTYTDFADGYPAVVGSQNYGSEPSTPYDSLLAGLNYPAQPIGTHSVLFTLESGIKDGSLALRLDGGCLLADCDSTTSGSTICSMDPYVDTDGLFDFEPDHLAVETRLIAEEGFVVELTLLDGAIPTLMETL